MEKIVLIDDDNSILHTLKMIIKKQELAEICGSYTDPADALEELDIDAPDIAVVDFLMPVIDGVEFVKRARKIKPDVIFVMLSQVSDEDMVSRAYSSGVEFFIHKPVNITEVTNVIKSVCEKSQYKRTVQQMAALVSGSGSSTASASADSTPASDSRSSVKESMNKVRAILSDIGILGFSGSEDILTICEYAIKNEEEFASANFKDSLARFTDSPKSMEQRIRRAAAKGLTNLAEMGIDDFSNTLFNDYASPLYGFDQVRAEMNHLQGKSSTGGTVKIRKFIQSLVYMSV